MGEEYRIGGRTALIVVIATILMVSIGVLWNTLLSSRIWIFYNPGSVNCSEEFTPLPYLVILLGIIPFKLLKGKVDVKTLTCLYIASIFSSYMAVGYGAFRVPPGIIAQRWLNPETISPLIPEFIAPPREIAEQIIYGGTTIPWNYWMPVMLYWWFLYSFFGVYMLSIATIWQKEWIEVEQVPFPQTLAVYEIVKQSEKKTVKPYIIGVVLGFAFQFIVFLTITFPWFPDVFSWRCATECYGAGCIPTNHPLYSIVALAIYSKNPSLAALFYMAPLSTLFTSVICNLFLFIGTQVAYYAGYYTGLMTMPGCGRAECGPSSLEWGAPFKWTIVANMGGGLGLVLMYVFMRRRYLAESFKAILKPEEKHYKAVGATLILSYLVLVGLLSSIGISILNAILMPIMVWLFFFAAMFVYGRTGYNAIGLGAYGLYWLRAIWPELPERADANYALTCILMRQSGSDGLSLGWGGALAASFAGYKFANLTKTDTRSLYYIMLIIVFLIPLVWWLTILPLGYSVGLAYLPFYQSTTFVGDISYAANPDNPWSGIAPEVMSGGPWIPNFVAGMVVIWVLSWLHARFVAFPLDPYGFLLTFGSRCISEGIWVMVTAAWVLKLLTLKIGGSKAYEEHGVPVATGFLLGYALAILAGGVISAIRFFIPF
ncbi:MAG: DUF6785 family protein [Candidatus Bathyarchaeia archaeon]